ncbi:unnamed protein product, partial [Ectocarpus sp. 13 AM-2016]
RFVPLDPRSHVPCSCLRCWCRCVRPEPMHTARRADPTCSSNADDCLQVDWTTLTKKWAVDIQDGMHHLQHATRMLAHLLVHRMCQDREDPGP